MPAAVGCGVDSGLHVQVGTEVVLQFKQILSNLRRLLAVGWTVGCMCKLRHTSCAAISSKFQAILSKWSNTVCVGTH